MGCPVCMMRRALDPDLYGPGRMTGLFEDGRFDHYELVRKDDGFDELGRGSMGVTYRAFDTVLGHAVAIKVIDARIASRVEARERFFREARAAARLRHPNVASVLYYGVREADGQCFYAMELVEGETLEARLCREGPLPPFLALDVVAQTARALSAAELQRLVHRDLKPSNLMLADGPESTVKIIDFGLAKLPLEDETDLTQGGFVGTPAFASPEQFAGTGMDGRSDLYSLGVTLWKMLTGKSPFAGSAAEVKYLHQQAPLPLAQLKNAPQPIVVLLEILLEKDPTRRFQRPAELLKAIKATTEAITGGHHLSREALIAVAGIPAIASKAPGRAGPETISLEKISVARLPVTGSDVFGREEDLAFLDDAWADRKVNVVTVVAWAGVGKSTLINHWLRRMATQHYRSAELVFGWSFYRQGTRSGSSSADEFFNFALSWFGDPDPQIGTAWEKGERLAKLVAHRRSLLILDGLEPLQNPPGPQEGRLREPSLQALLRELAAFNEGLCVVATRIRVPDIADHERTSVRRLDLEQLNSEAGAALLRSLGVKGRDPELQKVSDECSGHCLALTLLGSYLCDAYNGDIRRYKDVSYRLAHDVRQGAHARKVMQSYEDWFGEGPELSVLRILGLFDRPVDEKALKTLLKPPAIRSLTESLTDIPSSEWRTILAKLRRARLLAREDLGNRGYLDTHPLVREYFGEQFRNQMPEAWKESHRRLYYYYQTLAPELPDNFREMEPLFLAVICGCRAGFFHEALNRVYLPRIQRGNLSFAARTLGARGALLSVLLHFFEDGWKSSMGTGVEGQTLTAEDQLYIFMQAGLLLTITQGLGAPEAQVCYERAEPLCYSLNRPFLLHLALTGQWRYSFMTEKLTATMQVAQRVYALASEQNDSALMIGAYRALAFTLYFMGDFENARQYAKRGVQIWRSRGAQSPIEEVNEPAVSCLIFEAISEWHFGKNASCQAAMAEAISLAKELNDRHGLVVALIFAGILAQLACHAPEVERLASEVIEMSTRQNFSLWLAGGTVLLGWAHSASGNTGVGLTLIEEGIEGFRETGSILMLPYCLALKAEALHFAGHPSNALETLKEAELLIEKSEERWWWSELQRLRGVFLDVIGAEETQVAFSLRGAIRTAREQKSIALTARAEASYAKFAGKNNVA